MLVSLEPCLHMSVDCGCKVRGLQNCVITSGTLPLAKLLKHLTLEGFFLEFIPP